MKSVTAKQKTKADLKREQIEKDKKRAAELVQVIADLEHEQSNINLQYRDKLSPYKDEYEKNIAPIEKLFEGKLEPVQASLDAAQKELLEIGQRNRNTMFDVKGHWELDNGYYLHVKTETKVVTTPEFDLVKFMKKFAQYVDVKFKIAPLKKLFTNGDERKKSKIDTYGIDLKNEETIVLKHKVEEI
ncbi:hypothetical protein [Chryseosolibacter indicus]|uniref:Uncharacterized protein n=1 Tax=Chryseosolibacter indicus TaxID=2782351 RepID=A0ABS5VNB7_9BACT|nr:hypothetical protein [Chryseosolibacter indicus]MBT1702928.1 hypothetical protein [Chryseosolibacter indicus]